MECINLRDRFGRRYRIEFDPAYDPKHRPREKLDPWMMVIPCPQGAIYPHGGSNLVAEIEGRAPTARKLRELDCTTVMQDGDGFLAVIFDVDDFARVARLMKPRLRRQVSEAQREASRQRMLAMHRQNPSPASVNRAPRLAGASTR